MKTCRPLLLLLLTISLVLCACGESADRNGTSNADPVDGRTAAQDARIDSMNDGIVEAFDFFTDGACACIAELTDDDYEECKSEHVLEPDDPDECTRDALAMDLDTANDVADCMEQLIRDPAQCYADSQCSVETLQTCVIDVEALDDCEDLMSEAQIAALEACDEDEDEDEDDEA